MRNILLILVAAIGFGGTTAVPAAVTGLPDFTELVSETSPAVVNIRVTTFGELNGLEDEQFDPDSIPPMLRPFINPDNLPFGQPDRSGAGSGFIIESDGYVITNNHVVENADEIIVRLADRREFEARLIGSDPLSDIALLKIDAEELPTLDLGHSDELQPGQWVVAIGSPFNFDQSVTAGIVSALGRSNASQQYVPFIQTDVAINRGNSGGPLLNLDGEVVGINSWILSSSGGFQGLSFSIPVEVAQRTVRELRETGRVQRGLLGVQVTGLNRELAEAMQLDRPVGALVSEVSPDSAAEEAGIEPGDVILAFDGEDVETSNDLPPLVGSRKPGTRADVVVSRNGERRRFEVVLDELPAPTAQIASIDTEPAGPSNLLGLAVQDLPADLMRELDDDIEGVLVAEVESEEAYRAGLREGDVILEVNNRPVDSVRDFSDVVDDIEPERAVALRVWRNGTAFYVAYTPTDVG